MSADEAAKHDAMLVAFGTQAFARASLASILMASSAMAFGCAHRPGPAGRASAGSEQPRPAPGAPSAEAAPEVAGARANSERPHPTAQGEPQHVEGRNLYTDREMTALTTCVLHADVAAFIADRRQAGQTEAEQLDYYASRPNPELYRALVKDMYARRGAPFDMVYSFVQDCAAHLAELPPERRGRAAHCLARAHIANLTARYKRAGWSEQRITDHFAVLDAEEMVVAAYAHPGNRVEAALAEWRSCISPVSSKCRSAGQCADKAISDRAE